MNKIYKNTLLTISFLMMFVSSCQLFAGSNKSGIDELRDEYCHFTGVLKSENRWEEEFKMLEEPSDHPNFQRMNDILSILIILPKQIILDESCVSLRNYLSRLIEYHKDSVNISESVKLALGIVLEKLYSQDV